MSEIDTQAIRNLASVEIKPRLFNGGVRRLDQTVSKLVIELCDALDAEREKVARLNEVIDLEVRCYKFGECADVVTHRFEKVLIPGHLPVPSFYCEAHAPADATRFR